MYKINLFNESHLSIILQTPPAMLSTKLPFLIISTIPRRFPLPHIRHGEEEGKSSFHLRVFHSPPKVPFCSIKFKDNGCGTAPGNLVLCNQSNLSIFIYFSFIYKGILNKYQYVCN